MDTIINQKQQISDFNFHLKQIPLLVLKIVREKKRKRRRKENQIEVEPSRLHFISFPQFPLLHHIKIEEILNIQMPIIVSFSPHFSLQPNNKLWYSPFSFPSHFPKIQIGEHTCVHVYMHAYIQVHAWESRLKKI